MCLTSKTVQHKIGNRINILRLQENLSYQELADQSGVEKSNLIKIINNSKNPTVNTLHKISAGLNTRLVNLFDFCNECEKCTLESMHQ